MTRHQCALPVLCLLALCGAVTLAQGATKARPAASDTRFSVVGPPGTPGEQEVRDAKSRLIWRRCVEGMSWRNGTCTGSPRHMDLQQAQALALAEYKATGVRWRLPHVTELRRLLPPLQGKETVGPLDPVAFPAAPAQWHWTGSTTVSGGAGFNPYNYGNIAQGKAVNDGNRLGFMHGWAVHLGTGEAAGDVLRRTELMVRLVRPDL